MEYKKKFHQALSFHAFCRVETCHKQQDIFLAEYLQQCKNQI
jgi:hypothetical protein